MKSAIIQCLAILAPLLIPIAPILAGTDAPSAMEGLEDKVQLQVGDLLSVRILEGKDKTLHLRVQASGDIQFPQLDLIHAAGRTCKQLADDIKGKLEPGIYPKATVIVTLDRRPLNPAPVMASCTVICSWRQDPQKLSFDLNEKFTLTQMLLRVGNDSFGMPGKGTITRQTQAGKVVIPFKAREIYNLLIRGGDSSKDLLIQDGDVIEIPEKHIDFQDSSKRIRLQDYGLPP